MQAVKQAVKTETAQQRPAGAQMALRILLSFIKIGAFTFGSGWSIVAQMEQEFVDKRGWMTKSDLLELIAVGKSLPGIMVVNITMLFGYQMAGALGGICAAVGLCIPAVITLTVVTAIYDAIWTTTGSGRPSGASSAPWPPSSEARPSPSAKTPCAARRPS